MTNNRRIASTNPTNVQDRVKRARTEEPAPARSDSKPIMSASLERKKCNPSMMVEQEKLDAAFKGRSYTFVWYPERNVAIVSGSDKKKASIDKVRTYLGLRRQALSSAQATKCAEFEALSVDTTAFQLGEKWMVVIYSKEPGVSILPTLEKYFSNLSSFKNQSPLRLSSHLKVEVDSHLMDMGFTWILEDRATYTYDEQSIKPDAIQSDLPDADLLPDAVQSDTPDVAPVAIPQRVSASVIPTTDLMTALHINRLLASRLTTQYPQITKLVAPQAASASQQLMVTPTSFAMASPTSSPLSSSSSLSSPLSQSLFAQTLQDENVADVAPASFFLSPFEMNSR